MKPHQGEPKKLRRCCNASRPCRLKTYSMLYNRKAEPEVEGYGKHTFYRSYSAIRRQARTANLFVRGRGPRSGTDDSATRQLTRPTAVVCPAAVMVPRPVGAWHAAL